MRTSVHVYARVRNERTIRIVRVTYYETLTSTLNFEAISSFGSVNKPPPTIAILAIHVLFLFFTFFPLSWLYLFEYDTRTRVEMSQPSASLLPRENIANATGRTSGRARSLLTELVSRVLG